MMNNKGQTTAQLLVMIPTAFIFILILGSFLLFFAEVDEALQGNLVAGQVNLTNASDNTIGAVRAGYFNGADLIGIFFLFGVIISIMINGFMMRNQTSKMFFMIDFLLIIFAYILAVYVSNSYETVLAALPFLDLINTNLSRTSQFTLLLPQITVVVGFITMILTYAGIPRARNEAEVPGF